jgi:2-dehydropantoate 2-reductase
MRLLFYGAGVLGSLYAAHCKLAGHNVTVLARVQRRAEIQERGIELHNAASGARYAVPMDVIERLDQDDVYDWIVVLMRKNQVGAILPTLAANATPNVLFMTNNAAGPDAYVQALRRDRVVMGFPGAGGAREHGVITYSLAKDAQPTTLGELDGAMTVRLGRIATTFEDAGFPVALSRDIDGWLKTHVALVSPIANALYAAGGDPRRLARTRDALVLMVRAMREGLEVLQKLDVTITPARYQRLLALPEPLLVAVLGRGFTTERAELLVARHANAARDEMAHLATEFQGLARQANVPTPAIDALTTYIDPVEAPLPEGSRALPVSLRSAWLAGAALVGLLAGLVIGRARRKH